MKRAALRLVGATMVGYVAIVGLMTLLERPLVYPAPDVGRDWLQDQAHAMNAAELELTADDGTTLYGWRMGDGDRLVVYFSGNGSTVAAPIALYQRYLDAGFTVLHVNYRGYPGSTGSPDEPGINRDALATWRAAVSTHAPDRIVVHGRSLGGGVAMALLGALQATDQPLPASLVLEATFTSIWRVAANAYPWLPVRSIMSNRFESDLVAPDVAVPTVIVHGNADEVVPYAHGEELARLLPHSRLITVDGGAHNDFLLDGPGVWQAVLGAAPPSSPRHPLRGIW